MDRQNLIAGLRKLADIFEGAENLPVPNDVSVCLFADSSSPETAKANVRAFVAAVGKLHKVDREDYIRLVAEGLPAGITFRMFVRKELLGCRKVKRKVEVVEEKWECGPLLDEIKEESDATG